MATLTMQVVGNEGRAISFSAAAGGGDAAATGSGAVLLVNNGGASPVTVTMVTPGTVEGLAITDRAVTVAAGAIEAIPLDDLYTNPSTGLASITYSAVTSVTVAAVRVP